MKQIMEEGIAVGDAHELAIMIDKKTNEALA